ADDAEHGAEEADEGRVVAERAEDEQPLLVLEPAAVDGGGDRLLHRLLPRLRHAGGGADHVGLHRVAGGERGGAGEVALEAALDQLRKRLRHAPPALATRSAFSWTCSRCCSAVASLWKSAASGSETSTCAAVPAANCARM